MTAAETFACPACGKTYRLKPEVVGRKVGCKCGERFRVPEPAAAEPDDDGPLELSDGAPAWMSGVEPAAAPAACSRCGTPLKPGAVLCLSCGTDQRTGAAAVAPPAGDDGGDEDDAPEPTRLRMTATLWGVNAQILSLLGKGVALVLGVVAAFATGTPAVYWTAVGVELAAACLGGLGAVLCLFAPSPLAGRLALAGSLAAYLAGFGLGVWDESGAAPAWGAWAAGGLNVAGLMLFLGFLISLAAHLDFPEVTDDANKVFGTTLGAVVALAIAAVMPFGSFLLLIGVLALAAWAFWLYASLLIDLSRSVAYRRDRG